MLLQQLELKGQLQLLSAAITTLAVAIPSLHALSPGKNYHCHKPRPLSSSFFQCQQFSVYRGAQDHGCVNLVPFYLPYLHCKIGCNFWTLRDRGKQLSSYIHSISGTGDSSWDCGAGRYSCKCHHSLIHCT
jgi:hypothetical protein